MAAQEQPANKYVSKRFIAIAIALALLILSFILVKPYIAAVLTGIFLAYIFYLPYTKLNKVVKKPGVAAAIICVVVVVLLGIGLYFMAQVTIREAFNLYMQVQKMQVFDVIDNTLAKLFTIAPELSRQISLTLQQSAISLTNTFINFVGRIITNAPQLMISFFITLFCFFYFLKEGNNIIHYIRELLPFSSEANEHFLKRSQQITQATLRGQIAIGVIQGIVAGILLYVFHAPSPLFFTILAVFAGILPFIGPWLVLVPVGLIMMASGSVLYAVLLMAIGLVVCGVIGEIGRPLIAGKISKTNPALMFIGMIGGLALIGPIGMIVGPLILEYMTIFIHLYRKGEIS
jgi:predicted PurR-regulated permease PerM